MRERKGLNLTIRIGRRLFGFANKQSGPCYAVNNVMYGRPCIHFGRGHIQLPVIHFYKWNKPPLIGMPGWKYFIRLYKR